MENQKKKEEPVVIPATSKGLRELTIEITKFCNLFCVHCYADAGPKVRTKEKINNEKWHEVLTEAKELGVTNLQITGGEPSLSRTTGKLLNYARELGFEKIKTFTNAYSIPSWFMESLEKYNPLIKVSFYSVNPKVHDEITTVNGSQKKVIENILKLLNKGLNVRAGIVLTPINDFAGNLESTTEFLYNLGVQEIRHDYLVGEGRGADLISDNGYDRILDETWKAKLAIDSEGNVFPYIMSQNCIVGNIQNHSLKKILNNPEVMKYREQHYRRQRMSTK